jgi:hypothetical protein
MGIDQPAFIELAERVLSARQLDSLSFFCVLLLHEWQKLGGRCYDCSGMGASRRMIRELTGSFL